MNTKKIFLLLSIWSIAIFSFAQYGDIQNTNNALNFSQTDPIMGTARYSGMGGAMGALGGDASTMKDNPAGLGIYRKSDLSFTPNVYITNDNSVGFNVNNFAFILKLRDSGNKKGYISSSLGIGYNRLKNFKRHSNLGYMSSSISDYIIDRGSNGLYDDAWDMGIIGTVEDEDGNESTESLFASDDELIENRVSYSENGSIGEWNFSYGMNISNMVYWGISMGVTNLDYTATAIYNEWNGNGDTWSVKDYYEANGTGINFKFGAIVAPTDFMRIGVAFHTPTFYNLRETHLPNDLSYNGEYAWSEDDKWYYDEEYAKFDLQTPLRLQGSLGFIIGKRAVIGLEYQYENFRSIRTSDDNGLFRTEKDWIKNNMKESHTAKIGAEVNIIGGLSLRAGFAFVSSPVKELDADNYLDVDNFQTNPLAQVQNTFYYTGGIGYRGNYFYSDLAFVYKTKKESFFEYLPTEGPIDQTLNNSNIMATFGFRF